MATPTPTPTYKTGKLPPKFHPRTIMGSAIFNDPLPGTLVSPIPHRVWREYKVPAQIWNMFGNDLYGDCTIASAAHIQMLASAHTGTISIPTTEDVLAMYSRITGFDRTTRENDNGAVMTDVMADWMDVGLAGDKILGWVKIDHTDINRIKQAVTLFGSANLGVEFPNSAMVQFRTGLAWSLGMPDGGIESGHCVPVFGYGSVGCNCITWARRQGITWDWFRKYCVEAYAIITPFWLNKVTQVTPSGLNLAALKSILAVMGQGSK